MSDGRFKKGNEMWRRAKYPGRPPMYTAETLWAKFLEYMEWNSQQAWSKPDFIKSGPEAGKMVYIDTPNPPSIGGFAVFAGMTHDAFIQMPKNVSSQGTDIGEVVAYIKDAITSVMVDGANANVFNANITSRLAGLVDKKEVDVKNDLSDDERKDLIQKIMDSTRRPGKKEDDLL